MISTRTHAGIVQYTLRPEPSRFRVLLNHFGLVLLLAWNYSLRLEGRTAVIGAALLLLWLWITSRSLIAGLSLGLSRRAKADERIESLLVIQGLGLQITTTRGLLLASGHAWTLGSDSKFIPLEQIRDIFLLEGITGWTVSNWIAVCAHEAPGEELKLHVVFEVSPSIH